MRTSLRCIWVACFATASALAASDADTDALARARQQQLDFRLGNLDAAGALVKGLEAAVEKSPGNADLWEALGHAYMSQQGAMYGSGAEPAAMIAVGERARNAYSRALAGDPMNALLVASHGMATFGTSLLKQDGASLMAGIEEMNAAVRQAPKSTPVRLTRGFTIIHLPPDMRDNAAVVDDLSFILDNSPGGRPEDVLHVLLGDLYAETGKPDDAKREYAQVTGASRFAMEQVQSRLEELKEGPVSHASIVTVRAATGYKCFVCHAPGVDP